MPLTTSDYDPIEERRRKQLAMQQQSVAAANAGTDALAKMEALARQQRADARQERLDGLATNRLVLEERKIANDVARAAGAAATAARKEAREVENHEAGKLTLRRANEKAARDDARLVLERVAQAGVSEGLDDRAIIERASATPGISEAGIQWGEVSAMAAKAREKGIDNERQERFHRDSLEQQALNRASQERAAGIAAQKAETPDEKSVGALQESEAALARLDEVIRDKKKFNTGAIVDPLQDLASAVLPESVYDGSERNAWKAKVQQDFNAVVKNESGSAVAASELTRQLVARLNTTMDDGTFEKVAADARASYARDIANHRARLTPSGRRGVASPTPAPSPVTAATQSAAQRYRAAPPEQRQAINDLVAKGVPREQAVAQILGGG